MDNPTRWNITNSAQNIVSALVDPSKQFDHAFRREWTNTFSGFTRHKPSLKSKQDAEFKSKLAHYVVKLENRKNAQLLEQQSQALEQDDSIREQQRNIVVPEVFMMEDFDLSNLEIFNEVISSVKLSTTRRNTDIIDDEEDDDNSLDRKNHRNISQDEAYKTIGSYNDDSNTIVRPLANKLLTKNQLKELHQNFTDYLDIIEERLASQISNRSGDFFQVMSSVDSVMDELSLAIKSVTNLRGKCSILNDSLIWPNMKIIHISRNRSNAKLVLDKMEDIAYLCKVQPMIQLLLSASDFVGALDLISKSRDMLRKKLPRVVCLKHLESQLVEIERVIGTMMQQEFVTLITSHTATEFNNLSKLVESFANGFSEISERNSLTLLSLLQTQAEKFVNKFHEERKKRIESQLDIEQWKMVEEIPHDFQRLISMLIDENTSINDTFSLTPQQQNSSKQHSRASSDAAASAVIGSLASQQANGLKQASNSKLPPTTSSSLTLSSDNHHHQQLTTGTKRLPQPAHPLAPTATTSGNVSGSGSGNGQKYVIAGGSTYVIVNSVINLVQIVMEYCKCAQDIRPLSAELLERLFKILQLYNSKTYHLVYSAGAIQVAGLKTITTRSLIVSQRSLKLITLLIPSIQQHFSNLLPHHNRLRRFDEIKLSYEDHAAKIPERVNSIVRDVIDLRLQEWEAKPPVPSPQFSAVAQHLMRLHDNIQDALPPDELKLLFLNISQTFKDVLIHHLRRLNIKGNDTGPQQWIVTQELTFYKISSSKLDVFKGWELNFEDLWTKLNSDSSPTPAPAPDSTPTSTYVESREKNKKKMVEKAEAPKVAMAVGSSEEEHQQQQQPGDDGKEGEGISRCPIIESSND